MGAGGGGGGGGPGGFMTGGGGGRGSASALTRATAILAAAFFATSLTLAILAGQASQPTSVFDAPGGLTAPPAQPGEEAPDGAGPGILEQLQRQQGDEPDSPQVPQSALSANCRKAGPSRGRATGPFVLLWMTPA